ncbi:MAG: pyridoxal phosphate-dependent aminotransferase [Pseudomonadota bacterium]
MLNVIEGESQNLDMPIYKDTDKKEPIQRKDWHFRDVVRNLTTNAGAELLNYARTKENVISLAQGEGSLPTPDFIIDAATKAMKEGHTKYGPVLGQPALRQEIANYYVKHYDINLPTNRIYVTGSGTTAMHLALTAILNEGDEVVAVTPIWKNLLGAVEIAQGKVIDVPLEDYDGDWHLDLDKLFDAVTPDTQALLIVSPSNPTGWILPEEDVKRVLDFAREHDIWIISDEVYTRTTFDTERAPSFLDYADEDDKLFVVNSFSKLWAMTGWRIGWLVGPAKAEKIIRDIAIYDNMGPCTFSQFGCIEALRHGEDFVEMQRDLWRDNRDYVMRRLEGNNRIHMNAPQATFYGFLKIEGVDDCVEFCRDLIDGANLSLSPGSAFGKSCKGYLRICYGVEREVLDEALDRLEAFVNK